MGQGLPSAPCVCWASPASCVPLPGRLPISGVQPSGHGARPAFLALRQPAVARVRLTGRLTLSGAPALGSWVKTCLPRPASAGSRHRPVSPSLAAFPSPESSPRVKGQGLPSAPCVSRQSRASRVRFPGRLPLSGVLLSGHGSMHALRALRQPAVARVRFPGRLPLSGAPALGSWPRPAFRALRQPSVARVQRPSPWPSSPLRGSSPLFHACHSHPVPARRLSAGPDIFILRSGLSPLPTNASRHASHVQAVPPCPSAATWARGEPVSRSRNSEAPRPGRRRGFRRAVEVCGGLRDRAGPAACRGNSRRPGQGRGMTDGLTGEFPKAGAGQRNDRRPAGGIPEGRGRAGQGIDRRPVGKLPERRAGPVSGPQGASGCGAPRGGLSGGLGGGGVPGLP
jgi:hypothetical protein